MHCDKLFLSVCFCLLACFCSPSVNFTCCKASWGRPARFTLRACNKFLRHGLCQGEVVGCIVWWLGLHPAQVITIQSIAFPEEVTHRPTTSSATSEKCRLYSVTRRTRRLSYDAPRYDVFIDVADFFVVVCILKVNKVTLASDQCPTVYCNWRVTANNCISQSVK